MKEAIATKDAPAAIGPYSQAIRAGGFLFVSGQIPLDPVTGQLVAGDVAAQADRVLQNLVAILGAAGCSPASVVRTTIYLTDLAHFATVNEAYGRIFTPPYPARVTIQVAALPRGAQVEIDALAVIEG
jgi:2-iminobutanoate/2-iminopropanoate deaminase